MKVETKPSGFQPIIITIQTEEEARAFFHLLNRAIESGYDDYKRDGGYITTRAELERLQETLYNLYKGMIEGVKV